MWKKYFYFVVFIGLFFSDRDSLLMWYNILLDFIDFVLFLLVDVVCNGFVF